jgi:hypothetical protein
MGTSSRWRVGKRLDPCRTTELWLARYRVRPPRTQSRYAAVCEKISTTFLRSQTENAGEKRRKIPCLLPELVNTARCPEPQSVGHAAIISGRQRACERRKGRLSED